jgi:hypothetical protein
VIGALVAIAGASQIMAGFTGPPTALQLVMTVLHALVAGGVAGWMALHERRGKRKNSYIEKLVKIPIIASVGKLLIPPTMMAAFV